TCSPPVGANASVIPTPIPSSPFNSPPTTSHLPTSSAIYACRYHLQKNKSDWFIQVTKPILILGDSNLARIPKHSNSNIQMDSYPGAAAYNIMRLLTKTAPIPAVQMVILSFGLNNREQDAHLTTHKQIRSIFRLAKTVFPGATLYFPHIQYSSSLPLTHQYNLDIINNTRFTDAKHLAGISDDIFTTRQDIIHWDLHKYHRRYSQRFLRQIKTSTLAALALTRSTTSQSPSQVRHPGESIPPVPPKHPNPNPLALTPNPNLTIPYPNQVAPHAPHSQHYAPRKFIHKQYSHTGFPTLGSFSLETTNIVYIITCTTCHKHYVGETGHSILTRLKQHLYNIREGRLTTPLVHHFQSHPFVSIIISGLESNDRWTIGQRKRAEKLWIQKLGTTIPRGLMTTNNA
ncbi:hypothetical protein F7725_007754, partial [Dissostichus mawsoni]